MIHKKLIALALVAATSPAFASSSFTVDFENVWTYGVDINDYYNGANASDGSNGGSNLGVSFVNVSGLSNDAGFTYYTNAPSIQGTAYAHDTAYMNVAAGVDNLSFWYSSAANVAGAVTAWSGLNGTGIQLGSFDLVANDLGTSPDTQTGAYTTWTQATFNLAGSAQSFDLTALGTNNVAIDNVSSVPVPAAAWLLATGLGLIGGLNRRKKA